MKNYYLSILVLVLLSFNSVQAQFCPPTGFATPDTLYFIYDAGTSDCGDRPTSVTIGASVFTQTSCSDELSVFALTSGAPLADPNTFAADFGFSVCEYSGGTLSTEQLEMIFNAMLKVYPNPVTKGQNLQVELGINTNVKVAIYSVTGKQILSTDSSNLNKVSVDISSLNTGIYVAQIITDLTTITRKIIVMN